MQILEFITDQFFLIVILLFIIYIVKYCIKHRKNTKINDELSEKYFREYEQRIEQRKQELRRNVESYEKANISYSNSGPTIYAYTTPEIAKHKGWTKIGYTEQSVEERIKQQVNTADIEVKIEWYEDAYFADNRQKFTDKDFHTYLRQKGYTQKPGKEWFEISPETAKRELHYFKFDHGRII